MNQDAFNTLMGIVMLSALAGFIVGYFTNRKSWVEQVNQLQARLHNTIRMHNEEINTIEASLRAQQRQTNNQNVRVNVNLAEAIAELRQLIPQPEAVNEPRCREMSAAEFLEALPPESVEYLQAQFHQQRQLPRGR